MALALLLSTATPTFAYWTGTPGNSAQVPITKVLRMPVGTTTPEITFEFEITPISVDGDPATTVAPFNVPPVTNKLVPFGAADTGFLSLGIKTVAKDSANIFDGIVWPHAGVYKYRIVEKPDVVETLQSYEEVTFSSAEYEIVVYVDNSPQGLYIAYAEVWTIPPAPVDPDDSPIIPPHKVGSLLFENTYIKSNTTFVLTKEVDGLGANQNLDFNFDITINAPNLNPPEPVVMALNTIFYNADLYDATGTLVDSLLFESGVTQTVQLKHGWKLEFTDLPVGATIDINEWAEEGYIPNYILTLGGGTPTATDNAISNISLAIPTSYITEGVDSTAYLNTRDMEIPGGIRVENLPYYALIGAVLVSLAGYAVLKTRKEN